MQNAVGARAGGHGSRRGVAGRSKRQRQRDKEGQKKLKLSEI
jgi:hypothetical protein